MKTVDFFDTRAMEGIRQALYNAHEHDVTADTQSEDSDVTCRQAIISHTSFQHSVSLLTIYIISYLSGQKSKDQMFWALCINVA